MTDHGTAAPRADEDLSIVTFDESLSPHAFEATLEVCRLVEQDEDPGIDPMPAAELRSYPKDRTSNARHLRFIGFEGDPETADAIALAHLELTRDPGNPQLAIVELDVRPGVDRRRTRPLLRRLADEAVADGRTSMLAWGCMRDEIDVEWQAVGMERRYTERVSVLDMAGVDADLMAAWIADGEARNPDLTLEFWSGRCPDHLLDAYVETRAAMNDAPIDDLEWNDEVFTAESVRREESARDDVDNTVDVLIALDADGRPAGMTSLYILDHRTRWSYQGDTVALAEFRGRRIGRWLKAEMWRRTRAGRPEIERLRTDNAESNEHMLAINVDMGYRPHSIYACWQNDIEKLEL